MTRSQSAFRGNLVECVGSGKHDGLTEFPLKGITVKRSVDSILFVCTGNVFRSLAAELALKAYFAGQPAVVESAGTLANQGKTIREDVDAALRAHGLDGSSHTARRLTQDIVGKPAVVVAMGRDHQAFLRHVFEVDAVLFNQLAYGTDRHLEDLIEAVPDYKNNTKAAAKFVRTTIDYIVAGVPALAQNI